MYINRIEVKGDYGFEQEFGDMNIILGENKTGKSTMLKLILYALGTYVDNFIDEIKKLAYCSQVEIDITCKSGNGFHVIRKLPYSDMVIIIPRDSEWGLKNDDMEAISLDEYSNLLLNEEGYNSQEISYGIDKKATLRFYFLLRAVVVDQDTKASSILADLGGSQKEYINSQAAIKKAIIEELIGRDNKEIVKLRFEYKAYQNERKDLKSKIQVISDLIKQDIEENKDLSINIDKVKARIEEIKEEKKQLLTENIKYLSTLESINNNEIEEEILVLKISLGQILDEIRDSKLQGEDIEVIEKNIRSEVVELRKSLTARQVLLQIPVQNCPVCLSKLNLQEQNGENCPICNKKIDSENINSILRFKKMLEESLIEARETKKGIIKEVKAKEKEKIELEEKLYRLKESYFKELEILKNPINEILISIKNRIERLTEEEEKLKSFYKNLLYQIELVEQKVTLDTKINSLRNMLEELEQRFSSKEISSIEIWKSLYNELMKSVFWDINYATIDEDYMPIIDGSDAKYISSASLKVTTRLNYILSLFLLKDQVGASINHLGFVYFDSPKDKDLEMPKYRRFLEYINKTLSGQVFLAASITEKEIYDDIFGKEKIVRELTSNEKLLIRKK